MRRYLATRWLTLWLGLLLPCLSLEAQSSSATPEEAVMKLMRSGAAAMHQGNAADAEAYFRQAIKAAPTMADGYLGLGMAELREGKYDGAQKSLSRALELDPTLPGTHMFLGIAQYQGNNLGAATASLKQELIQQPENVEALTWQGIVALGAGHPEDAVGPLDHAAVLRPQDPNILDYRGRAHALVARDSYRRLSALDPDSWRVHRTLGEIYSESRQPEKAIVEFQDAIKKQTDNADLYEALGNEFQRISKFEDAMKAYEAELKLSPRNAIALYNLGKIQVQTGDAQVGVSLLRQAVEAHARPAPTYFYLGLGLAKIDDAQEAAKWLEQCLDQGPSPFIQQSAYYELVRVYQKLHRTDDGQRALEELKKLKAASAKAAPTRDDTD